MHSFHQGHDGPALVENHAILVLLETLVKVFCYRISCVVAGPAPVLVPNRRVCPVLEEYINAVI